MKGFKYGEDSDKFWWGGQSSDELTALLSDVIKDKTAVTNDSDDDIGTGTLELTGNSSIGDVLKGTTFYNTDAHNKLTGTLELTGNATVGYVYPGYTFYNTNAKNKLTGTLNVNSISSFSVSAYSGRRVLASWKNPTTSTGKPYSGVYIRYSTSGYPGKTGGTQIYKGAGNNTSSGGSSSVYLDMPNLSTTYYFSIYPYVTCSAGELTGNALNASRATSGQTSKTFTGTQTFTIPYGYTRADIFCVGGGGNGGEVERQPSTTNPTTGGAGGGGGYTKTVKNVAVTPGGKYSVVVGGSTGTSSFGSLCSAAGGKSAPGSSYNWDGDGGDGGSGGGAASNGEVQYNKIGGAGGSNGGNGGNCQYTAWGDLLVYNTGGKGQGTTTRAFGESSGTLYSGGGGSGRTGGMGGSSSEGTRGWYFWPGTAGGAGGGGGYTSLNGSANTGGGGCGQNRPAVEAYRPDCGPIGYGGSGIVLIRLY